jgi:LCP family protein required for cell wall assembly
MPFFRRRLILGFLLVTGVLVLTTVVRLGWEWSQALADIDEMIVTPVVLDEPTAAPGQTSEDSSSAQAPSEAAPSADNATQSGFSAPTPEPTYDGSTAPLTILLLGTDARPGDTALRTDALVLVRLNRVDGSVSMLSLPRDLWVTYPNNYGKGRINAAYALGESEIGPGGGAAMAKATVGKLLGLRVDHFVMINFKGFETLIDGLDGIRINVPEPIYDPAYPTDNYGTVEVRFPRGLQTMSGERALIYARTRHADSDFGRNQRQQQVLVAIFDRIRERGLLQQLTSLDEYTGALRGYVQTDIDKNRMLEVANWARTINIDDVERYAIDASVIVELRDPATFAVEPKELKKLVGQFTGEAISKAGGE